MSNTDGARVGNITGNYYTRQGTPLTLKLGRGCKPLAWLENVSPETDD